MRYYRHKRIIIFFVTVLSFANLCAGHGSLKSGAFSVEHELILPGSPDIIYDAISGDISCWWDHSFKENPLKLYIEAKPGGGFYEIFNEKGDGALHATVIYAERGKMLRFTGPLGLSGNAINMVHTYTFEAVGSDSTRLNLSVHASGEFEDSIPATIDRVWFHFLFERFKPYIENRQHLNHKD